MSAPNDVAQPGTGLAAEIDRQIEFLHRTRSVFPRLHSDLAGQKEFEAPEYYRQLGYNVVVKLSEPMTPAFIDGLFEIGHWLNENFIVRLCAVLECHAILGEKIKINQELDGWKEVDLARRLRNKIAHGSGQYDQNDPEKNKLYEAIVTHFQLDPGYTYLEIEKYPIGVGQVLVPLAEGCKRYAQAFAAA